MTQIHGRQVRCNKCGYVGSESEFWKGRDFSQNQYVATCANKKCDNRQSPGDASFRMFSAINPQAQSLRPFVFVDRHEPEEDALSRVLHASKEAS